MRIEQIKKIISRAPNSNLVALNREDLSAVIDNLPKIKINEIDSNSDGWEEIIDVVTYALFYYKLRNQPLWINVMHHIEYISQTSLNTNVVTRSKEYLSEMT